MIQEIPVSLRNRPTLIYKNYTFILDNISYTPKYDSFFLEENIILNNNEIALDITTGIGFHAIIMANKASRVIGVDINPNSVEIARFNAILNSVSDTVDIRCGDLFCPIKSNEKFDLIIASPPQMPTPLNKERNDWIGKANFAGKNGRKILDIIIREAKRFLKKEGRLQILHPMYSNIPITIEMLKSLNFDVEITAERYFPVGVISSEYAPYLAEIGLPLIKKDGKLMQKFAVITASRC